MYKRVTAQLQPPPILEFKPKIGLRRTNPFLSGLLLPCCMHQPCEAQRLRTQDEKLGIGGKNRLLLDYYFLKHVKGMDTSERHL